MKKLKSLAENAKINSEASIRDSQAIIINAPIDKVWDVLIDIKSWNQWNEALAVSKTEKLEAGISFKWSMSGLQVFSTVQKIQSPELLTWTTKAFGIKAIHVWRLEESDKQTIVTSEASIQGFRTLFFSHHKLHSALLNWLDKLKQRAEQ